MILNGFDERTMKKAFDWFLHDAKTMRSGKRQPFNTRAVAHSGKGSNANLNAAQINESEKEFKNSMALLYLKTFYGKKPEEFRTSEYRQECERLHSMISSSSNPSALKSKIEECLHSGHVDYISSELPRNLFYSRLSEIGLSTDELDHSIFVTPKFVTQARIYINPSQKDYSHLMAYLYEQAASQELEIGTKTRLSSIGGDTLDNMIIYTTAKDFPKIVEILNGYGKKYPDKVAQFGDTIECLGRSEQDWFGFGYDPQRDAIRPQGNSTFNSAIDGLFNSYILPAIMLDDFGEITKGMSETQLTEIFMDTCKNQRVAKQVALALQDPAIRRQFINNFCDLTYLREKSNGYTRDNARLSEAERNGRSPEQLRFNIERATDGSVVKGQADDFRLLQTEKITIPLRDGSSVVFSRDEIAQIMKSPILRSAMEEFYDTPEEIDREVAQMTWLWKYAGKNMPYLNENYPFLTDEMVREIEKSKTVETTVSSTPERLETKKSGYERWLERQTIRKGIEEKQKRQEEIIVTLCSGRVKLATTLLEMGVSQEEIRDVSRDDLEKLYIMKVGLDNVIEAASYVKSLETPENKIIHRYENSLQALRHQRGKVLCDRIRELPTKTQRNNYAMTLSQYAREDAVTEYQWQKNMSEMDEYIRAL